MSRAKAAISALKKLGFPSEAVKPVLKDLLILYDKKWEFIEAESYRALLDAVLEAGESKDEEASQPSASALNCSMAMAESPPKRRKTNEPPSRQAHRNELLKPASLQSRGREKHAEAISPLTNFSDREAHAQSVTEDKRFLFHGSFKEPKIEPGVDVLVKRKLPTKRIYNELIQPHIEPYSGDFPQCDVPLAAVHPLLTGPTNEGVCDVMAKQYAHGGDEEGESSNRGFQRKKNLDLATISLSSSPINLVLASSSSGEVKLSLTCDTALSQSAFRDPNLDVVLKLLEDKCLKQYKIREPSSSVATLLEEFCQSFLELATEYAEGKLKDYRPASNDNKAVSSNSLAIVPGGLFSFDDVRPSHDVTDITKGEEKIKISVASGVSNAKCPTTFYYIPENIVYQNAYISFSLARIGDENCCSDCFGNCLSSSIPCACARETGGEFAYTLDGLIREEFLENCISMKRDPHNHSLFYCQDCPLERSKNVVPVKCKGHNIRKFIKECWSKCGCNKQCGNRVVQRGITHELQVFCTSEGKGWGLRTLEELPRGTFVCEYVGEILTNMELYDRNVRSAGNEKHTYPVLLDADWGSEGVLKDEEALCLDGTFYGNVARYINHRCSDANMVEMPVEVETPDHHYYHVAFFTTRKVEAVEELTWDYGIDFADINHPVKAFRCHCGSKFLSKIFTSNGSANQCM